MVAVALLATFGVVVTALLTGLSAYLLFDLSWLESVLLGAVLLWYRLRAIAQQLDAVERRLRLLEARANDPPAAADAAFHPE